jgi:hypothetical protein
MALKLATSSAQFVSLMTFKNDGETNCPVLHSTTELNALLTWTLSLWQFRYEENQPKGQTPF